MNLHQAKLEMANLMVGDNRSDKERFGFLLAADPTMYDHLWCWMVDVVGREAVV